MNFTLSKKTDEPEINLIPFIDVLLVVLIFLMLSTTYSKFTELQVKLPTADTEQAKDYPKEIVVAVGSDGRYAVGKQAVDGKGVQPIAQLLREAAGSNSKNTVVIISADALASHQSVMTVMEAARAAGLSQVTFAAQQSQ
ncbi:MAG: biopolymer transporter ExbD [Cytophagales bacterium]|nr:biopolymer transporter ExbD [Cytophagales bacterium]